MNRRILIAVLILLVSPVLASALGADENLRVRWSKGTVRWGEPITLEVTSRNLSYFHVDGGITVSFSSNVIVVRQDPEATIHYENSEVFKVGHREKIRTRDIMVENWYWNWPSRMVKTMRLTFFPIRTGVLRVKVRAAFIRSLHRRDVINHPTASVCRDQQGYPALCYNIFVEESPNLLDNLRRIVNSELANDPAFLRNLQTLINNPYNREALSYFGIASFKDSPQYLESALKAFAARVHDPSIRNSPHLMTYLRRLINNPTDIEALRFFKLYREESPSDPREEYIDQCKTYLLEQQGGVNLLSLIAAEGDISFGYSPDDRWIEIIYDSQRYRFPRRPGVVLKMVERIMRLKPRSRYINRKEEINGFSYSELRNILLREEAGE